MHVPSPAELLSNFAANQAREAAAREAAERAAAAAAPPPAPVPEPPTLPHPWQAFWDASSERYYFGHPTTGQVQWDMPVAAPPPPPPPPVRPAYTEASYERLVAELAEVRVRPSQDALDILRRQEVTVEDLCDLTHAMLVSRGARSDRRSHDLEQNRGAPESPDRFASRRRRLPFLLLSPLIIDIQY